MEITDVSLYTVSEGNTSEVGVEDEESQYWGGGWAVEKLIANPMSIYDEYRDRRTAWMGPARTRSSWNWRPTPVRRDSVRTTAGAVTPAT